MNRKVGLVSLTGLSLIAALALTGCATEGSGGVTVGVNASSSTSAPHSASPTPKPSKKPASKQTAKTKSTVKAPSVLDKWSYPIADVELTQQYGYTTHKKVDGQSFPVFEVGSNGPSTIWPDSVRDPITTQSPEEVEAAILAEPDYCAENAVGLYNTPPWVSPTGEVISAKENNPWLKKWFPTDITDVSQWAADKMSGDPQELLQTAKKCALVAALFAQLTDEGVQTRTTLLNYHINTQAAATVDPTNLPKSIRAFALNPSQYTGEFIVLEFQLKGWPSNCANQILINTEDGRFALPNCTPPPPTTTQPKCEGSTCVVKTCASVYGKRYPYGTYPVCKDGPGNGPNGTKVSGPNANSGLDQYVATPPTVPGTPYTAPAPPSGTSGGGISGQVDP